MSQLIVPVSVGGKGERCTVRALIDSGVAGNFIDVQQMNLPLWKLAFPVVVHGVTGEKMSGSIYYRTHPFVLQVGALHTETVEMLVLSQAKDPLILRFP